MCGFAAVFGAKPVDPAAVEAVLASRGPDGRGLVCDEHRWMLHRRLSIIDLSDESAQPFVDSTNGSTSLYNGELYNYERLRSSLDGLATTGDTEVFARLATSNRVGDARGMYAGVVEKDGTLTVTRDRFGIKPLYRAEVDGGVAFASQVRCFPAITGKREINPEAIASVLRFGSVIGTTMFKGVEEVPPGTTTVIKPDGTESVTPLPPVEPTDLGPALRRSVERHLVSDVPVAVLLSGGLDSAVIAKLAAETGAKPVAVTLSPGGDIDETERAARTARHYGLEHIVETVDEDSMLESIDAFFDAMDQPSIDGFNTFLVSRAIKKAGFKVALSGLGADELFGGYSSFRRIYATHASRLLPGSLMNRMLRGRGANGAKIDQWVIARHSLDALAAISREAFSESEVTELTGVRYEPEVPHLDGADEVIASEIWRYMSPMLLRDADAQSMSNSVELRVPFLDDEVVGAALRRSTTARAVRGKKSLPAALDDSYLSKMTREPKTGFRLPFDAWLDGPLSDRRDHALTKGSGVDSFLEIEAAARMCSKGPWSRSWLFLVLDEWLARHA